MRSVCQADVQRTASLGNEQRTAMVPGVHAPEVTALVPAHQPDEAATTGIPTCRDRRGDTHQLRATNVVRRLLLRTASKQTSQRFSSISKRLPPTLRQNVREKDALSEEHAGLFFVLSTNEEDHGQECLSIHSPPCPPKVLR